MPQLKLYGTGSATANNVANITIPNRTILKGVQVSVIFASITNGASLRLEVSRASATEIAINGSQQCVLEVGLYGNFVTSGLAQYGINEFFPLRVPVSQGQIVYLHAVVAGTLTYYAAAVFTY